MLMSEVVPVRRDMGVDQSRAAQDVKVRMKQTYMSASSQVLEGDPVRSIIVLAICLISW